MRKPGVDTVIIGARNEEQLRDNLAAANWALTKPKWKRSTRSARGRCRTRTGISRNSPATAIRRRSTCAWGNRPPVSDRLEIFLSRGTAP